MKKQIVIFCQNQDEHVAYLEKKISLKADVMKIQPEIDGSNVSFSQNATGEKKFIFKGTVMNPYSVWYRRPQLPLFQDRKIPSVPEFVHREFELFWNMIVSSISEKLVLWISHPLKLLGASVKTVQLANARRIGFKIPPTMITTDPTLAREFCEEQDWQIIVKTLGAPVVSDSGILKNMYARKLDQEKVKQLESVSTCPVILQKRIRKRRELRVTVIGTRVFAFELIPSDGISIDKVDDWRSIDPTAIKPQNFKLPPLLTKLCVELVSQMGLNFSTMDIIEGMEGDYYFLDLNPNGQWLWLEIESDKSQGMSNYFIDFLCGVS